MVLDETQFDLHSLVQECVKVCLPLYRDAEITVDCSGLKENLLIKGDRRRLGQVIMNLLGNAIKFTGREGRIAIASQTQPSGEILLTVADNGVGVPAADLNRIFSRFEQVVDKERGSAIGTGIGLALVKSIVQLHGGTADAVLPGLDGRGVTFRVTLPPRCNVRPVTITD